MRRLQRLTALLATTLIVAALTAPVASAALLVTARDDAYTAVHSRPLAVNAANGVLENDSGHRDHRGDDSPIPRTGR